MINKYALTTFVSELSISVPMERILLDEPMSEHTTFAVGGPADVLILPESVKEMSLAIRAARRLDLPVTVLGGGSNVLVRDGGIRGVVIQLNTMKKVLACHDRKIMASAGFMLKDICQFAQENSLTGIEFACGIPGTLGGAVFMNAGAYDGEMSHVVSRVRTVNSTGGVHTYDAPNLGFSYRQSRFQKSKEFVVEVELTLRSGDPKEIQARMDDLMNRRRSKQPLEMHSAGSTFKRPVGQFAGKLIEDCGLRGFRVGGAAISEKHCGFVINRGGATCADVVALTEQVRQIVEARTGFVLEREIRVVK